MITTGRSVIEELAHAGCPGWSEGLDAKEEGRMKVKEFLHYDRRIPIDINNKPKLFFHKSRCPLTIKSVRNHQYEEWQGKTKGIETRRKLLKRKIRTEQTSSDTSACPTQDSEDTKPSKASSPSRLTENYKYTNEDKMLIITMIAQFYPEAKIISEFAEKTSQSISMTTVRHYKHAAKWQRAIERIREQYLMAVGQVAGAHKRIRMERYERLYRIAYNSGKYGEARKIISDQRVEMEGSKEGGPTLNVSFQQLNLLSDEELEKRRQDVIKQLSNMRGIKQNAQREIKQREAIEHPRWNVDGLADDTDDTDEEG